MVARRARWALVVASLAGSTIAHAQPSDQRAAAQVLFEQGRALVERKQFAEACPKFAESNRLDPGIGTALWLADCLENAGQTASAWATFKEAAAEAARKRDAREKVARDRAALLEPRLGRLTILVPKTATAESVEIRRDGVVVGPPEWGIAVPVDPGTHTVSASAPGKKGWSDTVRLGAKPETLTITVPTLEDGEGRTTAPPPEPRPTPPERPIEPVSDGSTQRVIAIAVAGVGVVGVGVGAFFGLHAKATYDKSNANGHCLPDNECDAQGKSFRSDAKTSAAIATVAFVVGAAAIAGGAVLWFTAPRARHTSISPAPSPDLHGAAVFLTRTW